MKSIIFSAVALAAAVSAQATTSAVSSTGPTCDAQPILEQCLVTTTGYLNLCMTTDYSCLCDKYTSIMTCFNNCPNDSREGQYSQLKQLNCNNASIYSSLSAATATTSAKGSSATAATATTTDSSKATGTSDSSSSEETSTKSASASGSTQTNAAGLDKVGSSSGLLVAVAGAVAALL
ncbi:hypothetical protein PFICI_13139 [Pestalotiopsis fici W106-1]|uniref:GPI anchored serine-threonine rich protein n=1 Tax=Pestalotiopsis fici (strain W106-1 / CGMCC3.15140) TaxID=1229662 RepID=W3WL64_PESFW|nr:uncharacterized protein PFICI_13139 [Pestalotiopsis fici W106-1]ETS74655.1 hypothetical protein PFICI_13139 [Pestalotiopsis fici W106-1]